MKTNSVPACLAGHTQSMARALRLLLPRHACVWAALVMVTTEAFGPQPVEAAVTEAWVHRYSNVVSNANGVALGVVIDAAGDIIVTGTTDNNTSGLDMLTVKYSRPDGRMIWQQRYNGQANLNDVPIGVAVDGDCNVVVTGVSDAIMEGDYTPYFHGGTYYTAKYAAADGALLWEKRYNVPGDYINDFAQAVAVDASGNVVVTGYSSGIPGSGYYTAKYAAADGALLWEKRDPTGRASAVAVDATGNVVVSGGSSPTIKYAGLDGALLWERRYNDLANDYSGANALALEGNGNVVVTGTYYNETNSNTDYYTAKYAATDGALLWERRYNGPANNYDQANAVAVDSGGNVVVTGRSATRWLDRVGVIYDFYTAKYAAADGALLWERRYNGPANSSDWATAVAVDVSGNVMVTGSSNDESGARLYTAAYAAADGALLWENSGPANGDNHGYAVAVDGSGNVVVTGSSDAGTGARFYTAKYAMVDGALLWEQHHQGPANRDDFPSAVAVDGSGNVVVTGLSQREWAYDYYTAKYAMADGALLWERRDNDLGEASALTVDARGNVVITGYSYRGRGYTAKYATADGALLWEQYSAVGSSAAAVALDGSGNVVIAGYDRNSSGNTDYYTAKYATANGALLWQQRYNGPANGDDRAAALAIDAGGNVLVTGPSHASGTASYPIYDYYTAKYAAADGALLWERSYNGPANSSDWATAVAVDVSGNVVVTGTSGGSYSYPDYYTAKYAATDGALVWEKRYNGPANSSDQANAVALDGSGNVVVTGSSQGDYYTAEYSGADGALRWEKRGPVGGGTSVRVDDSGNVVVTGPVYTTNFTTDYYTAKYAAANGALLWEKRYNGPANGNDFASGLALGPNGMVAITGSSDGNFTVGEAYDYATVVYRETLPPVAIELVPTGVRLLFPCIPGHGYTIERAPAVTGPWNTVNTQTAPASGLLEYLDANPPVGAAFYRTREP